MDTIHEEFVTTDFIPFLSNNGTKVYTLRTDKIHPVVSGNKWYKLRFHMQEAKKQGAEKIVTFGGAYSNHIVATAFACKENNIECAGIIRGESPENFSHTLQDAADLGMELHFVSRDLYKKKYIPEELSKSEYYIIPEGGYGTAGAAGAATIPYEKEDFDIILCAVGSGTMMAGLINAKVPAAKVMGISVMKNNFSLEDEVRALLTDKNNDVEILHDFHCGGYAKYNDELIAFMNTLYAETGIPTDFVYSAKVFLAAQKLIQQNYFHGGTRLLIIHCGGLQGNLSLGKGTLIF